MRVMHVNAPAELALSLRLSERAFMLCLRLSIVDGDREAGSVKVSVCVCAGVAVRVSNLSHNYGDVGDVGGGCCDDRFSLMMASNARSLRARARACTHARSRTGTHTSARARRRERERAGKARGTLLSCCLLLRDGVRCSHQTHTKSKPSGYCLEHCGVRKSMRLTLSTWFLYAESRHNNHQTLASESVCEALLLFRSVMIVDHTRSYPMFG